MDTIEKYGKLDMAWGGVGINGHFAFNEPPEPGENVSCEEFANRPTRVLKISRETKTIEFVYELRRRFKRYTEILHYGRNEGNI